MRRRGRPRQTTKSTTGRHLRPPLFGRGILLEEDEPAWSFLPEEVHDLIQTAGIEPVPGLVIENITIPLADAVRGFIMLWRRSAAAPPSEVARWAREVAKRAHAFLEIMRANPNDGELPESALDIYFGLLAALPPPNPFVHGDRKKTDAKYDQADAIRQSMARPPFYWGENAEIRKLFETLSEHWELLIPMPSTAVQLGLQGTAYIARHAVAAAEQYGETTRRPRQSPIAVLDFVADINSIYRTVFGKEGSIRTNYHNNIREGPVIGFTQAVMHRTACLLPEPPTMPHDVGMRQELVRLAGNRDRVADCIRVIRSRKWRNDH
jgi:hypothetical protein